MSPCASTVETIAMHRAPMATPASSRRVGPKAGTRGRQQQHRQDDRERSGDHAEQQMERLHARRQHQHERQPDTAASADAEHFGSRERVGGQPLHQRAGRAQHGAGRTGRDDAWTRGRAEGRGTASRWRAFQPSGPRPATSARMAKQARDESKAGQQCQPRPQHPAQRAMRKIGLGRILSAGRA
jgi:hypothetical protein